MSLLTRGLGETGGTRVVELALPLAVEVRAEVLAAALTAEPLIVAPLPVADRLALSATVADAISITLVVEE